MACVIAAPSSNSGKTLVSLMIAAWASSNGQSIQTFKVGPDYLDSSLLSKASKRKCRNLDLVISNDKWVISNFLEYGSAAELTLVEGVMGLYDGLGSSSLGSTADVARKLKLPIILTINAKGQAHSICALIKGFQNHEATTNIVGVVLNHVNTKRHKELLKEVISSIGIDVLGFVPTNPYFDLPSKHLGLYPPAEIVDLSKRLEFMAKNAANFLDLKKIKNILKAPNSSVKNHFINDMNLEKYTSMTKYPIAIADDKAFHFCYPETREYLEKIGMPTISWRPTENEPIPAVAKGLILPGGFPEKFADILSSSKKSITSLQKFINNHPVYAECGGMLLLGESLTDLEGKRHKMAGILPFEASKGSLDVGYRELFSLKNSLILNKGQKLIGHEFHNWQINPISKNFSSNQMNFQKYRQIEFSRIWEVKGWNFPTCKEGWSERNLHASWMHLHWPTASNVLELWLLSVIKNAKNL